jgi:hypothetical protein
MELSHTLNAVDDTPRAALERAAQMFLNWKKSFRSYKITGVHPTVCPVNNYSSYHACILVFYKQGNR